MSEENATAPASGWYDDPMDLSRLRWWDGSGWTSNTTPKTSQDNYNGPQEDSRLGADGSSKLNDEVPSSDSEEYQNNVYASHPYIHYAGASAASISILMLALFFKVMIFEGSATFIIGLVLTIAAIIFSFFGRKNHASKTLLSRISSVVYPTGYALLIVYTCILLPWLYNIAGLSF